MMGESKIISVGKSLMEREIDAKARRRKGKRKILTDTESGKVYEITDDGLEFLGYG